METHRPGGTVPAPASGSFSLAERALLPVELPGSALWDTSASWPLSRAEVVCTQSLICPAAMPKLPPPLGLSLTY